MIAALKSHRVRRGLTQHQLAVKAGESRHWLGKIERCELRLDVLRFARLCSAIGVSAQHMLKHLAEEKSSLEDDFFTCQDCYGKCAA